MPFSVVCPHCQKQYNAPDSLAGRLIACPKCGGNFQASPPPQGAVYSAAAKELAQDADSGQYSVEEIPAVQPERRGNFCPACGKAVPVSSRICISCGQDMHSPVVPRTDDGSGLTGGEMSALMDGPTVAHVRPSVIGPLTFGGVSLIASILAFLLHAGAGMETGAILAAIIAIGLGIVCMVLLWRMGQMGLMAAGAGATLIAVIFVIVPIVSVVSGFSGGMRDKKLDADNGDHAAINPVDRDLQLILTALGPDRLAAAQRLVEDSPAERYPEVSAALEKFLGDAEPAMRRWAVKGVALNLDARISDLLIKAVGDPDAEVRAAAMQEVGARREPKAVDAIMAHLQTDFDPAVAALKAIGPPAQRPLIALLGDADPTVRILGARALAIAGTRDAVPLLRRLSKDPDVEVARAAKAASRALAPDEFDKYATVLADLSEPSRRVQALAILAALIPPAAENPRREEIANTLAQQVLTLDTGYAPEYGQALAVWQVPGETGKMLLQALQSDPAPAPLRRHAILVVLAHLNDPNAAPALAHALATDAVPATRGLLALGAQAQDSLLPLLGADDPQTAWDACVILRQIGPTDKAAAPLHTLAAGTKNPALAALAKEIAASLPAPPH